MSSGTHQSALTSYRDEVAELMARGEPFGLVEDAIDEAPDLTLDEKAALWLFGFSLRDRAEQQANAREYLAALQ
jgi:hypothetical protein